MSVQIENNDEQIGDNVTIERQSASDIYKKNKLTIIILIVLILLSQFALGFAFNNLPFPFIFKLLIHFIFLAPLSFVIINHFIRHDNSSKAAQSMFSQIKGEKLVLKDVRFYNSNLPSTLFRHSNFDYRFDRADVILTENSIIIIPVPQDSWRTLPIKELSFNKRRWNLTRNNVKVIQCDFKTNKIIIQCSDQRIRKPVKVHIKSEVESIGNWIKTYSNNEYVKNNTF